MGGGGERWREKEKRTHDEVVADVDGGDESKGSDEGGSTVTEEYSERVERRTRKIRDVKGHARDDVAVEVRAAEHAEGFWLTEEPGRRKEVVSFPPEVYPKRGAYVYTSESTIRSLTRTAG